MATYRIGPGGYYANKRRYRPGEEIVLADSAIPAPHFIPVCDKAKEIHAAWYPSDKQVPQAKPKQVEVPLSPKEHQDKYDKPTLLEKQTPNVKSK